MKQLSKDFDVKYVPITETGCWIWLLTVSKRGYGKVWVNGKKFLAHRHSWFLNFGPIPDGMHVLHKCDIPSCVNPEHLFLGTHQDNMDDKSKKGRQGRKLNREQVEAIRLSKLSDREIASRLGISRSYVFRIRKSGLVMRYESLT